MEEKEERRRRIVIIRVMKVSVCSEYFIVGGPPWSVGGGRRKRKTKLVSFAGCYYLISPPNEPFLLPFTPKSPVQFQKGREKENGGDGNLFLPFGKRESGKRGVGDFLHLGRSRKGLLLLRFFLLCVLIQSPRHGKEEKGKGCVCVCLTFPLHFHTKDLFSHLFPSPLSLLIAPLFSRTPPLEKRTTI